MKNVNVYFVTLILVSLLGSSAYAQKADSLYQRIEVPQFQSINIKGMNTELILKAGEQQRLYLDSQTEIKEKHKPYVQDAVLYISGFSSKTRYILITPGLESIRLSDAAVLKSDGYLAGETIRVKLSGASEAVLMLKSDVLFTEIEGASEMQLSGSCTSHHIRVSGAGELKAYDFATDTAFVDLSGASEIRVAVKDEISGDIKGASNVFYHGEARVDKLNIKGASGIKSKSADPKKGTYSISIGSEKNDHTADTVNFRIAHYNFTMIEDEERKMEMEEKKKEDKYNTWAGIDFGVNGYLNKDADFGLPEKYKYLELDYAKSFSLSINIFQKSIAIFDDYVKIFSGLGLEWNNYRFDRNTRLMSNPDSLYGYIDSFNYKKSKLRITYLNLPLMLEFNTSKDSKKAFHLAGGLLLGYNIGEKTKLVYDIHGKKHKDKAAGDYQLSPFRTSLSARIGYGHFLIFANYSLNSMFLNKKGPELYPFTVGVSIISF